jgi:hypothetical protein
MVTRNLSMQTYWESVARDWKPLLRFTGSTEADWAAWRQETLPKYMELLGGFPRPVPLEAEVVSSIVDGDLVRERVLFQAEEFMSVPCVVLRPVEMAADRSNAAILCSHGHGRFGKDAVAGVRASPELEATIAQHNYNYGEQMARAGFLTLSPDLRAFGERQDPWAEVFQGEAYCNSTFVRGALLGLYPLTLNIWDMMRCVDYLETRPEVNPARIGMMGLSQGGTMTTFTTAAEPRIRAADIICYVNPFGEFAIKQWDNLCGSQLVPGLYRWLDTDDVAGLIAPRPLLMEMGIHDTCFLIEDTRRGYEGVRRIYTAAGVADRLWSDVHEGGHAFGGNKAFDFFKKYL